MVRGNPSYGVIYISGYIWYNCQRLIIEPHELKKKHLIDDVPILKNDFPASQA